MAGLAQHRLIHAGQPARIDEVVAGLAPVRRFSCALGLHEWLYSELVTPRLSGGADDGLLEPFSVGIAAVTSHLPAEVVVSKFRTSVLRNDPLVRRWPTDCLERAKEARQRHVGRLPPVVTRQVGDNAQCGGQTLAPKGEENPRAVPAEQDEHLGGGE